MSCLPHTRTHPAPFACSCLAALAPFSSRPPGSLIPTSILTLRLRPRTQVRIVDKSVRGGRVYLKKAVVVDVHPGGSADVAVDDTGDVLRVRRQDTGDRGAAGSGCRISGI